MARSRRHRGGRPASIRQTQWLDSLLELTLAGNSISVLDLTANLAVQEQKGTTIVRTILDLTLSSNAADVSNLIDMGIVLADAGAVLAGHLAQPEVQNDQPSWVWRARKHVRVANVSNSNQYATVSMDTKSKRKFVGNERDYLFVANNTGTEAVTVRGLIRVLIQKP